MYEKKREGGCAAKRDWPLTESGGKKQAGSRLPASSSIQALTTHYLTISVPIQSQSLANLFSAEFLQMWAFWKPKPQHADFV
ncbi:hypothetical protein ACFQEX_00925 [Roseibium salinum]|uniref:hypothetical protein n=1 Tax=Roseibium salinum TaxID=1604349 RepID=UPI00361240C8